MAYPYLKYGCSLEINSAQTAAFLANRCEFCGDPIRGTIDVRHGCDILEWYLDEEDGVTVHKHNWTYPVTATAPWVTSAEPASPRFIGFVVDSITEPYHISREVTQKISGSGGGILETPRPAAIQMDIDVLLFACDQEAMEYGFRYLKNSLVGGGCEDPCTLCELEFRDSCPDFDGTPSLDEFNQGRWILKNVGVTKSPEWIDPPVEGMDYYVRRARFSIASEFPWKFKCAENELSWTGFTEPPIEPCGGFAFETFFCGESEVAAAVVEPSIIGETAMIVEIQAGKRPLTGIEVRIIPDQYGWVCNPSAEDRPAGFVDPAPCDVIYIADLPARHTLRYDTATEQITIKTNAGVERDGTPYLSFDGEGGPPTYPTVRCGRYCVKVVADACSISQGARGRIDSQHREY